MVAEQQHAGRILAPRALPARSSGEPLPLGGTPRATKTGKAGMPGASAAGAPEQDAYFAELLGHPLERLSKEPELLLEDQKQLRRQTQDSVVTHYRAFLATAECAATAHDEAAGALATLDALAEDLPALGAAASGFSGAASALLAKKARNKQLQGAQGPVADVLEAPALMDTCVRNGHFDEALDLRAFIGTLAYAHGDVPVVAALKAETDTAAAHMLEALLGRLRGPVQLPECLRVIGYLRRLAVFSEQELRAQFLACREAWLAGLVAELEGGPGAYDALRRLTDVHRLHLFDAVMQFRAVFADEAPQETAPPGGAPAPGDGGLLFAWAERRITLYLEALRGLLPQVGEGGQIGSALEHCMYAGAALGRVGLDFRPALPPLFESRILALFTQTVATAVETFAATLETHRWLPASAAARARRLPGQEEGEKDSGPPYALMEAPPLAVFANGLAAALNELRHCPPLVLQGAVTSVVQDALEGLMAAMVQYGDTRSLSTTEKPLFVAAAQSAIKVLAPYAASCLDRVYAGAGGGLRIAEAAAPLSALLESWQPQPAAAAQPRSGATAGQQQGPPPRVAPPAAPTPSVAPPAAAATAAAAPAPPVQ